MTARTYWAFVVGIALIGASLRLVGLGRRQPTADELHYRGNMSNTMAYLRNHTFRHHSVRHTLWQVPHGLLAPAISFVTGRAVQAVFRPSFASAFERDNFLSRIGYALTGIALMVLLFVFGRSLLDASGALLVLGLAACSPILVNWSRSEYLDTPMTFFLFVSFYFLWRILISSERGAALSLCCGITAGLALASKWPALIILPFIPAAYVVIRYQQRGGFRWLNLDSQFILLFTAGLATSALPLLSMDSFRWAIHPPFDAPYGDVNVPFLERLRIGLHETRHIHHLAAVSVYWLGLSFLPFLVYSLRKAFKSLSAPAILLLLIFSSGILLTIIQEGSWGAWRATYPVCGAILLISWALQGVPFRTLLITGTFLLMLPITLLYGLRLKPAPVHYHNAEYLYSTPLLPLDPSQQIFH